METVNVVIDEASTSKSSKSAEQMPKPILPLTLKTDQEVGDQDPSPPTSPRNMIIGNINELTLRKRTIDKYMANFFSYSCYLSQVELAMFEDTL